MPTDRLPRHQPSSPSPQVAVSPRAAPWGGPAPSHGNTGTPGWVGGSSQAPVIATLGCSWAGTTSGSHHAPDPCLPGQARPRSTCPRCATAARRWTPRHRPCEGGGKPSPHPSAPRPGGAAAAAAAPVLRAGGSQESKAPAPARGHAARCLSLTPIPCAEPCCKSRFVCLQLCRTERFLHTQPHPRARCPRTPCLPLCTPPFHVPLTPSHAPRHAEPTPSRGGCALGTILRFLLVFTPGFAGIWLLAPALGYPAKQSQSPPSTLLLQAGAGAPQQRTGAPPDVRFLPRGCCRAQEQVEWGSDRGW